MGRPGLPVWQFRLIYSSPGHVCRARLVSDILTWPLHLKKNTHAHARRGNKVLSLEFLLHDFATVIISPQISQEMYLAALISSAALSELHLQTSSPRTLMFLCKNPSRSLSPVAVSLYMFMFLGLDTSSYYFPTKAERLQVAKRPSPSSFLLAAKKHLVPSPGS